jgi:hypothetical protein
MKQTYLRTLLACFCLAPAFVFAQGFGLPPGFDVKAFERNQDLAYYFVKYDSIWQSVSSFDNIPGSKDYICYPDKKGWKVVAGTVDSLGFKNDAVYYAVDGKNVVTIQKKKFDTVLVASMGRALFNSNKALNKLNIKSAGGWKKYVKQGSDMTLAVWMFPDADAQGTIYYGPELAWYYSSNGNQLTTSKIINKPAVAAAKAGQVLTFNLPADKMPSVGTIWLAHRYKATFTEINVNYKTGTSTYRYNAAEKTYAWEHVAN